MKERNRRAKYTVDVINHKIGIFEYSEHTDIVYQSEYQRNLGFYSPVSAANLQGEKIVYECAADKEKYFNRLAAGVKDKREYNKNGIFGFYALEHEIEREAQGQEREDEYKIGKKHN
jgi:hypothetical protein